MYKRQAQATSSGEAGLVGETFSISQKVAFIDVYTSVGLISIGCGLFLMIITPILKKLMHGAS